MFCQKVSVIILTYNSEIFIEDCLDSVFKQSYPCYEVIIVDNNSTDNTIGIINKFLSSGNNLIIIKNKSNLGYAGGNNGGIKCASGSIVAILNPDTTVKENWLYELVKPINEGEKVLTTSKIIDSNTGLINACGLKVHFTGVSYCITSLPANLTNSPYEVPCISGCSFAFYRDIINVVGVINDNYFLYLEDVEFSLRARIMGYKCVCTPLSVVYHSYNRAVSPGKFFYLERNRWLLLRQLWNQKQLAILFPVLLIFEFTSWAFAATNGSDYILQKIKSIKSFFDVTKKTNMMRLPLEPGFFEKKIEISFYKNNVLLSLILFILNFFTIQFVNLIQPFLTILATKKEVSYI